MSALAQADQAHLEKNYSEAIRLYRSILFESPNLFDAWYGLACASASTLEYGDAVAAYRRALTIRPDDLGLRLNLASVLFGLGHVSDAVRNYRIAATSPETEVRAMALRNLACIIPGDPSADGPDILDTRRAWAALEALNVSPRSPSHARHDRKLQIAYYGAFFSDKNWMKMYMGVLNAHDRDRFELNLIVDGDLPSAASGYHDRDDDRIWQVAGVPNAELARHIIEAEIDVLIDLNGYSHQTRLPLLLHRAAPLQVAWNGMYGTTGFSCVDILIADDNVLPQGEERHYSERIHRVRHTYLPFEFFYETPDVMPPPSLRKGYITFGSLNSAYKLTSETLVAWSRILRLVPSARLLVRNAALEHGSNRADLAARFAALGIGAERLTLLGYAEHTEFLRTYDRIDIALDTFPYNGGTTTVEALWQGVPVLTVNGDRWAGRTSRSILAAAGFSDWIAPDLTGFVNRAVALAHTELEPTRAEQRTKIVASDACDVTSLCRELEALYMSECRPRTP